MIDLFNLTAVRVHNMPDGWRRCSVDCHKKPEDFIEVRGAIPVGVMKSGPRKGSAKWPKELQTLWMRRRNMDRTQIEWESETGQCFKCQGSGQEYRGWSRVEGEIHGPCSRCNATGKSAKQGR